VMQTALDRLGRERRFRCWADQRAHDSERQPTNDDKGRQ
jgi:hypothetical protein